MTFGHADAVNSLPRLTSASTESVQPPEPPASRLADVRAVAPARVTGSVDGAAGRPPVLGKWSGRRPTATTRKNAAAFPSPRDDSGAPTTPAA